MNYKYIILLFFISGLLVAQSVSIDLSSNQVVEIDSIRITGNNSTEEYIILRELNITSGDSVTLKQIEFNQERVFSLGLFNKVKLDVFEEENSNILELFVCLSDNVNALAFKFI